MMLFPRRPEVGASLLMKKISPLSFVFLSDITDDPHVDSNWNFVTKSEGSLSSGRATVSGRPNVRVR